MKKIQKYILEAANSIKFTRRLSGMYTATVQGVEWNLSYDADAEPGYKWTLDSFDNGEFYFNSKAEAAKFLSTWKPSK